MEIICVDKQTFEELRVRFCDFEERMTRVCRPAEDLGLKNWLDNQEVCDVLRINKKTLQVYRHGPKRSGDVGVRSTEQSVGIKVGGF